MNELVMHNLELWPSIILFGIIAVSLFFLSRGADLLVDQAVSLSVHWGVPKMVIGATIVSLGTTLPEASVSVMAAMNGNPDMALGNAIGSIIADTSLIIGLAALMGHLVVDRKTILRQGKVQLGAGILLAVVCLPIFSAGASGQIYQWMGFVFLALLVAYIYISMKWAKTASASPHGFEEENTALWIQIIKLLVGVVMVIGSSQVLIPAVEIIATRMGIPQSVIAATLVAFGTSLPELVTAISAVKKGHGELAIGNIIGADILNVLFVVGSAAAVTKGGLVVPTSFYQIQIPTMLISLGLFRYFSRGRKAFIAKREGVVLLVIYVVYLILNYV
ncbi:calcium/sodium antiporter [Gottschalkiaceae bacterium SANA]|nr:calcium/sodium antiporter [Gottschalkiaceae bacterium SANA]